MFINDIRKSVVDNNESEWRKKIISLISSSDTSERFQIHRDILTAMGGNDDREISNGQYLCVQIFLEGSLNWL